MRYGISVPNFCPETAPLLEGSHARRVASWARTAEAAGWDGFFVWDHLLFWKDLRLQMEDPWVLLAAIADATERVRIGPLVTPIPRRRPWKLARECVSLDRLSNGRLILGVGLGGPVEAEYAPFAETTDANVLAEQTDEGLDVITGLWTGKPFSFRGRHFSIDDVTYLPTPLQQPRPPIWVGGTWPKKGPMRRAARWDGLCPLKMVAPGQYAPVLPSDVRDMCTYIRDHRASDALFDVAIGGSTPGSGGAAVVGPYAEAGTTWWIEGLDWFGGRTIAQIERRIEQGPPLT